MPEDPLTKITNGKIVKMWRPYSEKEDEKDIEDADDSDNDADEQEQYACNITESLVTMRVTRFFYLQFCGKLLCSTW